MHLHNGQQGVEAVQVGACGLDWYPDDGQWGERRNHARQVRRPARARDDGLRRVAQTLVSVE